MGGLLRQRQLLLRANQLIAADVGRGMALAPELVSACNLTGDSRGCKFLVPGSITLTARARRQVPSGAGRC